MTVSTTRQPRQLYMLFMTEMWERFGFYGMRALLVLFMTKELLYQQTRSNSVYAAYAALIYFGPYLGGMISDRFLGYRKSVVFGGILMTLGYMLMIPNFEITLYMALAFVVVGNSFFKSSVASLVGGLYQADDPRRDSGFTIFYVGINLGASISPLICAFLQDLYGTKVAFSAAILGMLIALGLFLSQSKSLGQNGLPPDCEKLATKNFGISNEYLIYILGILSVPLIVSLLYYYSLTSFLLVPVGLAAFGYILYSAFQVQGKAREQLFVVLVLMFFNMLFFSFFDMAATALTVFADKNVDRVVFGTEVSAASFIASNPTFTMLFGLVFSQLWVFLSKINKNPSTPLKFALALLFVGIGFGMFVLGTKNLTENGLVPVAFLLLGYLFHSFGELCLSPVGLSTMTKLAPKTITAMIIGAWYLCWSFSNLIAKELANLTVVDDSLPVTESALVFANVFGYIALVSVAGAVVLLLLTPILRKWMNGVH